MSGKVIYFGDRRLTSVPTKKEDSNQNIGLGDTDNPATVAVVFISLHVENQYLVTIKGLQES